MIVRSRAVPRPTDTRNPARPGPRAGRCSRRSRQIAVALLDQLRGRPPAEHGYGPGNLVNLLRLLRGDLRGLDLSDLRIRQAFLQEVEAQDASLARAHLSEAVLVDAFSYPTCVALSADGADAAGRHEYRRRVRLAASSSEDGTVRLWDARGGQPLRTRPGGAEGVRGVALSADGRLVAAGDEEERRPVVPAEVDAEGGRWSRTCRC